MHKLCKITYFAFFMQYVVNCIFYAMDMVVVMADIIGSSKKKATALMKCFRETVEKVNRINKDSILSPLTITLGDEFQGIAKTPEAAMQVVFSVEKLARQSKVPFKLRVVVHEGRIDTKINRQKAYEMLGPGLSEARERLTSMKTSRGRFQISLKDEALSTKLSLGMSVYQGIVDQWTPAQLKVVNAFEVKSDYRDVAKLVKRDPTVIWKRKRSLMIEEYNNIMKLIMMTINPGWKAVF